VSLTQEGRGEKVSRDRAEEETQLHTQHPFQQGTCGIGNTVNRLSAQVIPCSLPECEALALPFDSAECEALAVTERRCRVAFQGGNLAALASWTRTVTK
jgi:hypothetical protein